MNPLNSLLAKLSEEIFNKEVLPENIELINYYIDKANEWISLSFMAEKSLIGLCKTSESKHLNGPVLDMMMIYLADVVSVLKEVETEREIELYTQAKAALLVPSNPLEIPKQVKTYMNSRYSLLPAPTVEELEKLKIDLDYTVVDLSLCPDIESLFNEGISILEKSD